MTIEDDRLILFNILKETAGQELRGTTQEHFAAGGLILKTQYKTCVKLKYWF